MSLSAEDIRALPLFGIYDNLYDKEKTKDLTCMDIYGLGFYISKKTYTFNCKVNYQQCGWSEATRELLAENVDLLQKVEVYHTSFDQYDALKLPNDENVYFLVDPPYQHSFKKKQAKNWDEKDGYYKVGSPDYDKVLKWVLKRKGMVTVSESQHSSWVQDPRFLRKFAQTKEGAK